MTSTEDIRLERFSAGEQFAVDPDGIERELAAIWRTAGRSTDRGQPVTRACLWNVVVHVEERDGREGSGDAQTLIDTVDEMPRHLAARALVLRTTKADEAAALESWISANCILSGDGGKLVCSEEITLQSKGDADRRLPSLVRALLVPAVPTAVVFEGAPMIEDKTTAALIRLSDRIVVNVDRSTLDDPLTRVLGLVDAVPASAIDIGWLADRHLRQEIAALFDAPRSEDDAKSICEVRVVAPAHRRWSSRLLLGWVASALGEKKVVADGPSRWRGEDLELEYVESEARETTVTLCMPGDRCDVCVRTEESGRVEVTDERGTARRPKEDAVRAALLARALTTRSQDDAFEKALAIAEQMR